MNKSIAGAVASVALAALMMPVAAFANGWLASNTAFGTAEGPAMRNTADTASAHALNSFDVTLVQDTVHLTAGGGYVDDDGNGACDACDNASGTCGGYVDDDGNGACDCYEASDVNIDNFVFGCGCEQGQEQCSSHGEGKKDRLR